MRITSSTRLLTLALVGACGAARAQHVVVLEITGDKGKLRQQVEQALLDAGKVDLVPLRQYFDAAAQRNLSHDQAVTADGVSVVAPSVGIDAAVGGTARQDFQVRILGSDGQELWSREIPLRRGLLSADNARRLAKAIGVAALVKPETVTTSAPAPTATSPSTSVSPPPSSPASAPSSRPSAASVPAPNPSPPVAVAPPMRATAPMPAKVSPPSPTPPPAQASASPAAAPPSQAAPAVPEAEPTDAARPPSMSQDDGPRLITVSLVGGVTWRSYCSRPGVSTCAQYDALPSASRPSGETVTFTPQVPYGGFGLAAEGFPLSFLDNLARGIGLSALYTRSYSLTVVSESTGGSSSTPRQTLSVDQSLIATVLGRYYFRLGAEGLSGYAGVRVGLGVRLFDVDPTAAIPLPGAHRAYPVVGIEGSIPILRELHVDAGFLYFVNPGPGTPELVGYGIGAVAGGFSAELGVSGDLWGPFGYCARFRFERYADRYSGAGTLWSSGGADEESYASLLVGPTAHF